MGMPSGDMGEAGTCPVGAGAADGHAPCERLEDFRFGQSYRI